MYLEYGEESSKGFKPTPAKEKGWFLIKGFPYFLANDKGELKNAKTGYVTKGSPNDRGYMRACIWDNVKQSKTDVKVHRLICIAFNGPPPTPKHEVGHHDDDRANNVPSNLYWTTRAENMKKVFSKESEHSLEAYTADIEDVCHALSMEAMKINYNFANIKRTLPDLFNKLKDFSQSALSVGDNKVNRMNRSNFNDFVKTYEYKDIRHIKIMVPKGLVTTLKEYSLSLSDSVSYIDTLTSDVLVPFERFISSLIADPKGLRSLREAPVVRAVYDRGLDSVTAKHFNNFDNVGNNQKPYGEVFDRNVDLVETSRIYNELVNRTKSIDDSKVSKLTNTINKHFDLLVKRIEEDTEDEYKVSGTTLTELSKLCYLLAKEVEFYSIIKHELKELESTLINLPKQIYNRVNNVNLTVENASNYPNLMDSMKRIGFNLITDNEDNNFKFNHTVEGVVAHIRMFDLDVVEARVVFSDVDTGKLDERPIILDDLSLDDILEEIYREVKEFINPPTSEQ